MKYKEIHQAPEAATDKPKLAAESSTPGLQDIRWMMAYSHLCRRSVANLMRKGLPYLKLGRRILFHPASVESWLLRQQQGGNQ
ncbi:MAG: helix-turn-helix domain-containing protein [Verrucomicrobiota bacterium]